MARVLVIDDDRLVRSSIKVWLEGDGLEVVVADDGAAGLGALEHASFDIVVVDIFMPGMDGFESIQKIRRNAPGVPIIAMSGLTFSQSKGPAPDFLTMAVKLGATHCLRKPFKPSELLRAVKDCLARPRAPIERGPMAT